MNWEDTILFIRTAPEFQDLVQNTYVDEDLKKNVESFRQSVEFQETLSIIRGFEQQGKLLDVGSGNGISAVSFALEGFHVSAVEPDPSETVGAGAIRILKDHYNLENLEIYESFAEEIGFANETFDVVYARQAMHHANDLRSFVREMARVLKSKGVFLTVRDHVIFDQKDKEWFLAAHPLQKFYGGENAFKADEYKEAIDHAGLNLERELRFFDSPINFYPRKPLDLNAYNEKEKKKLKSRIGLLGSIKPILNWYLSRAGYPYSTSDVEKLIPGRMYSYIAIKR
jgi:ubiquinone/menaquinone biosynthesis C-methylase UbiE